MITILDEMRRIHQEVKDGDVTLAITLQTLAFEAVAQGAAFELGTAVSPSLINYMNHFTNGDATKLAKLTGQDPTFNAQNYAKETLVYALVAGCCGINTTCKITRDMTPEMRNLLR